MATVNCRTRGGKKVWLVQVRLKGLNPVSRQFDSKAAAQRWGKEEEARLDELRQVGGVSPEVGTVTIKDLIDRYLKDPKAKELDTYKDRERQLKLWAKHYGPMLCRDFGPIQILERRDALLAEGSRPSTVNGYMAAMRRAWNGGRNVRLLSSNSAWPGGVMLDPDNTRIRFLDDDELKRLMDAAKAQSPTLHASIVVAITTGLRVREQLRLEWRDVNFEGKALTIHDAKNDTPRSVHLPDAAARVLKSLKKDRTVLGRRIFLDPAGEPYDYWRHADEWDRIKVAAKIEDFRWHDLRHCCGSYLAQNGASLLEIAQVLGHKSLQATQRYAHLIPGAKVTGHDKLNAKIEGAS